MIGCRSGIVEMISAPLTVCVFMISNSSFGQLARLAQDRVVDADLADVVQRRADADQVDVLGGQVQLLGQQERIVR